MHGYRVSPEEMEKASITLFPGTKYSDLAIPAPNAIKPCIDHKENEVYWERDDGMHGWACPTCGEVTQWG
jgi:hypothetical protein